MHLNINKTISDWYYEHIALSSASIFRNTQDRQWRGNPKLCPSLEELYSSLSPIPPKPDWAGMSHILKFVSENSFKVHPTNEPLGVIVETRCEKNLEFVIENFIDNTGLPVQLFHGATNLEFILASNLQNFIKSGQVSLVKLPVEELQACSYNALFLSREFWESMNTRGKILVFQTDSCLCNNSDYQLNHF